MANNPAAQEKYFRRQAFYWLIFAGVILVTWLLIWLFSKAPQVLQPTPTPQSTKEATQLPSRIDAINELETEVPPIDFTTLVRDLRNYPAEFKDKHYFAKDAYVIEVMDVSENDTIVNYLNGRTSDRDKFAYFRYLDNDKKARFILTYGKFATQQEANDALSTDFGLPKSSKPSVVHTKQYLKIIDEYERGALIHNADDHVKKVKLQATRVEVPIQAATKKDTQLSQKSQEKAKQAQQAYEQAEQIAQPMTEKPVEQKPVVQAPAAVVDEPAPQPPKITPPKAEQPAPEPAASVPIPKVNTPSVPGSVRE